MGWCISWPHGMTGSFWRGLGGLPILLSILISKSLLPKLKALVALMRWLTCFLFSLVPSFCPWRCLSKSDRTLQYPVDPTSHGPNLPWVQPSTVQTHCTELQQPKHANTRPLLKHTEAQSKLYSLLKCAITNAPEFQTYPVKWNQITNQRQTKGLLTNPNTQKAIY